ncbi:MAG: ABC transporter ATP-binding protein [Anaerolineales bacterium]
MKKYLRPYFEVLKLLKRHPFKLAELILFSFIGTLIEGFGLALLLPILEGTSTKNGILGDIPVVSSLFVAINELALDERVRIAAVFLILTFTIRSLFLAGAQILSSILEIQTEGKLQRRIFKQVQAVQISYIHGEKQGNILEVLNRHTNQTGMLISEVINGITSLLAVIAYIGVMVWISWELTLITVFLQLLITIFVRQRLSDRIKVLAYKARTLGMQVSSLLVENLSAAKLIHLFSRETYTQKRFSDVQNSYISHYLRSEIVLKLSVPLYNFLNGLVIGLILIASTFVLPDQTDVWLGQVILFIIIIFRLMGPAARFNYANSRISQLEPGLESVQNLLRREDKPYLIDGELRFSRLKRGIQFEGVSFRYEEDEEKALKDITFQIPCGKMTAVVGESGAGKTTLVNLIARLYDPQSGRILLDGADLRDYQIDSWHTNVAVVSQDTFLFNATVVENLQFAKPQASKGEVIHAAKLAQAHEFIQKLPLKYETVLGDRGVRLSGGQQQRIAIARALLVNPQLLILDEATSDLDTETEKAIQSAIEKFSEGRTLFVIAHRLSTVKQADNIVVLLDGKVVEQGNHSKLMNRNGYYKRLVLSQDLSVEHSREDL